MTRMHRLKSQVHSHGKGACKSKIAPTVLVHQGTYIIGSKDKAGVVAVGGTPVAQPSSALATTHGPALPESRDHAWRSRPALVTFA